MELSDLRPEIGEEIAKAAAAVTAQMHEDGLLPEGYVVTYDTTPLQPAVWHALAPHIWTKVGGEQPFMVRNDTTYPITVAVADGRVVAADAADRYSVREVGDE